MAARGRGIINYILEMAFCGARGPLFTRREGQALAHNSTVRRGTRWAGKGVRV